MKNLQNHHLKLHNRVTTYRGTFLVTSTRHNWLHKKRVTGHSTRATAGPSISNILSRIGVDVLRISSCTVPEATVISFDTQLGEWDTSIDLKVVEGKVEILIPA